MKLSVIIPSYKGQSLLQHSLPYLCRALDKISSSEIIIIDNGSKDSTLPFLKHHYPDIRVKELETNYGFTKAVNTGITMAKGEYVLILNNDCHVSKGSVSALLTFLEKNQDIVATQPIVKKPDGSVENIGYVVHLKKGKAAVIKDKHLVPAFDNATIWQTGLVYGLSGACLMARRSIFKKVGNLDEQFHSYLEDVDFFIRLARMGYQYAPCLDAVVTHKHMSTSAAMKGYKEWHDMTNWVRIIKKNYPLSFIFSHILSLGMERLRNINGWVKSMIKV